MCERIYLNSPPATNRAVALSVLNTRKAPARCRPVCSFFGQWCERVWADIPTRFLFIIANGEGAHAYARELSEEGRWPFMPTVIGSPNCFTIFL